MLLLSGTCVLGADSVPRFNVESSCRAAGDQGRSAAAASACRGDEQTARNALNQSWLKFSAADRTQCVRMATLGGQPTYTELLTCLEMARDASALRRANPPPTTTGRAPR
jgi:hypothetical protein